MSKRVIHECDVCGKETPYESIYVTVARRMDAAGDMEDDVDAVDLCPLHMRALMAAMVKDMDHAAAAAWLKRAKAKPKPRGV